MTAYEAMEARHSVRSYLPRPIEETALQALLAEVELCNRRGGLHIQLVTEAPEAFQGFLATYGMLKGVRNYFVLAGTDSPDLEERAGYWGEHLVLTAQALGLNTCWVGGTYSKKKIRAELNDGEKLVCVIAVGYGADQGRPHKNKPLNSLCRTEGDVPLWFQKGMDAVLLAPTAINQQKFLFTLQGDSVRAEARPGPYSRVDLGIVKYHFEAGAGEENFNWA